MSYFHTFSFRFRLITGFVLLLTSVSAVQAQELKESWSTPTIEGYWTVDPDGTLRVLKREPNPAFDPNGYEPLPSTWGAYFYYEEKLNSFGEVVSRTRVGSSDTGGEFALRSFADNTLYRKTFVHDTGLRYGINHYLSLPSETIIWANSSGLTFDKYAVASDGAGGLIGASTYTLMKYDSSGNRLWTRRHHASSDRRVEVYTPNVIWTVSSSPDLATSDKDLLLTRYDGDGNQVFQTTWGEQGITGEVVGGFKIDPFGNLYVAGEKWEIGVKSDIFLAKFDPDGNELWVREWAEDTYPRCTGLVILPSGEILISGRRSVGDSGGFILSYDDQGTLLNLPYTSDHSLTDIELGPDESVYVSTEFEVKKLTPATSSITGEVLCLPPKGGPSLIVVARDPEFRDPVGSTVIESIGPYMVDHLPSGTFYIGISTAEEYRSPSSFYAAINSGGTWNNGGQMMASLFVDLHSTATDIDLCSTNGENPMVRPLPKLDYDGDGTTEMGVFNTVSGAWVIWVPFLEFKNNIKSFAYYNLFGGPGDIPVPGDYNGDGYAELAIFRPSTAQWFIYYPQTEELVMFVYGAPGDLPAPADYDGDRMTDVAVIRPSTMQWFIFGSHEGPIEPFTFGLPGMIPVPGDYDGDGYADVGMFYLGNWYLFMTQRGFQQVTYGAPTDIPAPGDYNGNGLIDFAVFRPSENMFYFNVNGGEYQYPVGSGIGPVIPAR